MYWALALIVQTPQTNIICLEFGFLASAKQWAAIRPVPGPRGLAWGRLAQITSGVDNRLWALLSFPGAPLPLEPRAAEALVLAPVRPIVALLLLLLVLPLGLALELAAQGSPGLRPPGLVASRSMVMPICFEEGSRP